MYTLLSENEQSSEGTEESRDLGIANLATVKSVNALSDILISLLLKLIF